MINNRIRISLLPVLALAATASLKNQTANSRDPMHVFFRVQATRSVPAALNGRLLIFVKKGTGDQKVDVDDVRSGTASVAAQEVDDLTPGGSIEVDANEISVPQAFSEIPPGDYEAQAVRR